ncbi:glycosyltransferase [Virgifigura deserti]|uniref:glycosyltransferase n=1 Tax=Virgifigura deserti TaxID=2268457 RepID=UPI003CCC2165
MLSWYFPPGNSIGAVRVGKLAKYFHERGHEVRVVAGRHWDLPETLPLELPAERVHFTKFLDVNWPRDRIQGLYSRLFGGDEAQGTPNGTAKYQPRSGAASITTALRHLSNLYTDALNFPDSRIGWLPWAMSEAKRICQQSPPDLIYASGPPFTCLLAGHLISRQTKTPWIAEFRDRWVDDPYNEYPDWRTNMLARLERRVVNSTLGIVTVSEPWAEFYREKFGKPIAAIYNGYDSRDFALEPDDEPKPASEKLEIVYTGVIYSGRRDPSPLFEALRLLGPDRERCRVVFYGSAPELVHPVAERCGVSDLVEVHPAVPYKDSIQIQRAADILLLLQWSDPKEQGNCPAKLFEYFGVLRPILGLGLENGVPAKFIRERSAGFFSNDPRLIADRLREWLEEKERNGSIKSLPPSAREGLSREVQFEKLEHFCLERLASVR